MLTDNLSRRTDPEDQLESLKPAASQRIGAAGVLLRTVGIALIPAAVMLIPTELLDGAPAICLFRLTLGVECPGCGMTRAVSAVLHGELARALAYNRGIVVVFPLLFFAWAASLRASWGRLPAGATRSR